MYKLMHNNMVVDLLENLHYVRYMKRSQRWIQTDSQSANGIMGSDNNTIYGLLGTVSTYPGVLTNVTIIPIDKKEFEYLSTQVAAQRQENIELRGRIDKLENLINEQNNLLKALVEKIS